MEKLFVALELLVFCSLGIGSRASAQASAAPPAHPVLVIQSTPGGAQVYVDNELLGTTSPEGHLKISTLKPGRHSLRLSLDGRSYGEGPIFLVAGKSLTKTFALTEQNAAANPSAKAPSVSDILSWISSHFETLNQDRSETDMSIIETTTYGMSFQGCQATLVMTFRSYATVLCQQCKNHGEIQTYQDVMTTGPFDLSNLRPDIVKTGIAPRPYAHEAPAPYLSISAVSPIPYTSVHDGRNMPYDGSLTTTSSTITAFSPFFATQDMANRQAKAWHDAIVGCGGKPVSDKLY